MYQTKKIISRIYIKNEISLQFHKKTSIDNQSKLVLNKKSILLFYLISQCESNLWITGNFCCKLHYQAILYTSSFMFSFANTKQPSFDLRGMGNIHTVINFLLKYAIKLTLYYFFTIFRSKSVAQ